MFLTKYPHRANFSFGHSFDSSTGTFQAGNRTCALETDSFAGGIHHIGVRHETWGDNRSLLPLITPPSVDSQIEVSSQLDVQVGGLGTPSGQTFGVSGDIWMFQFEVSREARFYGMGEKNFGRLELSGIRTNFWNTDVWGDFHFAQWMEHPADPPYLSVPYLIVNEADRYIGILVHTPFPVFMETPGNDKAQVFVEWQRTAAQVIVGAYGGKPDIWIIEGPSLRELTRKLQKLVGTTPLPPLWSLGYHQSRWGYAGHKELVELDEKFEEHHIPCDGLWLDIDYMNGYRVFTNANEHFPEGVDGAKKALEKNGRKIVPILDPGVKSEPGYEVFDSGKEKDLFCRNTEGASFIGMVWPGETVFPDFTLPETRDWWAGYSQRFIESGFSGAWLDMNDPSTGPVDPHDMLFNRGAEPHKMHRNQYALGMQMATQQGFLQAKPNERPFLLSRSGHIGTSRYSAIWTGDNLSTYFYLKTSIPCSLNLSLSGIPFSGPDVGGFGGDAEEQLMVDWIKAGFLFPFMRNHSVNNSKPQEPWRYSDSAHGIIRRFIRLRYKLLPYLYNLFIDQEEIGDPILRPLMYEFESTEKHPLHEISDEFMVGPYILQAPVIDGEERLRRIILPGDQPWYDTASGEWTRVKDFKARTEHGETPLYIRNGSIIPMQQGTPSTNKVDLTKIELHLFAYPKAAGSSSYLYRADDGISFDYREGVRSALAVSASWDETTLKLTTEQTQDGFGAIETQVFIHGEFEKVELNGAAAEFVEDRVVFNSNPFPVLRLK